MLTSGRTPRSLNAALRAIGVPVVVPCSLTVTGRPKVLTVSRRPTTMLPIPGHRRDPFRAPEGVACDDGNHGNIGAHGPKLSPRRDPLHCIQDFIFANGMLAFIGVYRLFYLRKQFPYRSKVLLFVIGKRAFIRQTKCRNSLLLSAVVLLEGYMFVKFWS